MLSGDGQCHLERISIQSLILEIYSTSRILDRKVSSSFRKAKKGVVTSKGLIAGNAERH